MDLYQQIRQQDIRMDIPRAKKYCMEKLEICKEQLEKAIEKDSRYKEICWRENIKEFQEDLALILEKENYYDDLQEKIITIITKGYNTSKFSDTKLYENMIAAVKKEFQNFKEGKLE